MVGIGLAATWVPYQVGKKLTHRSGTYRAVEEVAYREGWKVARLEILRYLPIIDNPDLPFNYGSVVVHLSSGEAVRCTLERDQEPDCRG